MQVNPTKTLNKTCFWNIVDKYDNFFFDCDGVLYNGHVYIEEAFEALNKLKDMGKNVFFVTNMSQSSRRVMMEKLRRGGFEPDMDRVYTSSYLAARYLALNHPEVKKVYMIGKDGLKEELEGQGITVVGGGDDDEKLMNAEVFDELDVPDDIQAVVAGIDTGFNYYKLSYASVLLQKGGIFIATNLDASLKLKSFNMPGGGAMVKAIEHASGVTPFLVGKPNPTVIQVALKTFGLNLERCLMIGDRLDTDIMIGRTANIDTFAVLTGIATEHDLIQELTKENGVLPTYYGPRVEVTVGDMKGGLSSEMNGL